MSKIDIQYIAENLGVAKSTVSKALNDRPDISEKTKQKILEFVRKTDYHPNPNAQLLKTGKSHYIALIMPHIKANFSADIMKSIIIELSNTEYRVIIDTTENNSSKEVEIIEDLHRRLIAGIIIVPALTDSGNYLNEVYKKCPIVALDHCPSKLHIPFVKTDFEYGSILAVRHLFERGHRQIGLILGPKTIPSSSERLKGYRKALKKSGLPYSSSLVTFGSSGSVKKRINELLKKNKDMSACICANSDISSAVLEETNRRQLKIPDDLAVIDFGNDTYFSTIDQKSEILGKTAARKLLKLIKGELVPDQTIIKPELVIRYST